MSDLACATDGAFEIVRTGLAHPVYSGNMLAACDGRDLSGLPHHMYFGNPDARLILGLDDFRPIGHVPFPTCPRCRVLIDAALEGHDLRAALATGAAP